MNPWEQKALDRCRSVMRFTLWCCGTIIGLMVATFAIAFTFDFLRHLWSWCRRVLFREPW